MKRFSLLLALSFALVSSGCEQQDADVDTAPPPTDDPIVTEPEGDPAVSGYRGEMDADQRDEPTGTGVLDRDPATTTPPADPSPTGQPEVDEPVVEEEPAESLPANVEDDPATGSGTGS